MSARFLVVTWDGGGNTGPAIHLGARLVARGHDVTLLGWPSMSERARAARLDFRTYPSMPEWPADRMHEDGWEDVWQMLNGQDAERDVSVARSCQPHVMVVDSMMGAAYRAAATMRSPFAALVHTLYRPFVEMWGDDVMRTDVRRLLAGADVVLALEPPGLGELPDHLPATTQIVGPVAALEPPQADVEFLVRPGPPWVLISLSTTLQHQAEALPGMLQAVASMPVRALLTLGGGITAHDVHAPPNVTVHGFLPHEAVLPHMSAVLTHAGLSTVAAALAAGVPLVCIPQGRDQPLNAARVEAVGAGLVLDPGSDPRDIATALERVRTDPAMRTAARQIAANVTAVGHGSLATDLVESLVATG